MSVFLSLIQSRLIDNSLTDRALEVLKHLILRESLWPNACAAAIRDLRGQLIDRRNRSKHTHAYISNNLRMGQGTSFSNKGSGASPSETSHNPELQAESHNPVGSTHQRSSSRQEPSISQDLYRRNQLQQASNASRNMSSIQEAPESQQPQNPLSGNFLGSAPSPFANRLNWMFSENMASFGDAEGNGYAFKMGAQLQPELQLPNQEGSDFFYGLDTPFWMRNDHWMGPDGNS